MTAFRPRPAFVLTAAILFAPALLLAQHATPHTINVAGETASTLGDTTFTNYGLQGVGRISGSAIDTFGETFGSVSGLQITNWTGNGATAYTGTFNILPDRGYNSTGFFSGYAARLQQVDFSFTPYTSASLIGGTTLAEKVAAQNQITFTSAVSGVKFTYDDPTSGAPAFTTGLDPGAGFATVAGKVVPYVTSYTGSRTPGSTAETFTGINKLAIDAEAIALKPDGSGYIGDEYGANVYYFDASKKIIGVITPPAALQPHAAGGALNFNSITPPADGRRNNQGMEGIALSPDGTRLFTLLQSATVQDTNGAQQQTRRNARLVIYDVGTNNTPGAPSEEYVIQLPTFTQNGQGGAVNATAAQSEIVALDNHRFLVLSRDGAGQGSAALFPTMYKSVLLVDTSLSSPTNIAGTARDAVGGKVTSTPGVLDPLITPLSQAEALNLLNIAQLGKFNFELDTTGLTSNYQVNKLTLSEKWEGMSLVSANDASKPNDYFLFIANDNDFLTSAGKMVGPDGTLVTYDAFSSYPALRKPAPAGASPNSENDTTFLVYRVAIVPEPCSAVLLAVAGGSLLLRRRRG